MNISRPLLLALLVIAAPSSAQVRTTISRAPGTVTLIRDDWGVPHLYAAKEEDGYFGLGYAIAEDRLENVLRRYLAAQSRLASVYGPDSLEKDFWKLRWNHLEEARRGYRRLSPQLQLNYKYFIAGLEQYMKEHPSEVPAWAPTLEPASVVAWNRAWLFPWSQSVEDCERGGITVAADGGAAFRHEPGPLLASNGWALMPWRVADNASVLVGDSHSSFTGNGEMFEYRMDAGDLKVSATSGLATGWVVVGHTRYHAWTTTNSNNDTADCYEVEVDSANPLRYRYDGAWREMTTRRATVEVKGAAPVTRTFEYTNHNGVQSPVIARRGTKAYVLSNPYTDQSGLFDEQMYRQLKAKNLAQFIDAERMIQMWPTNVVAAEANGNILYLRTGRIPIRPPGYDWTRPVPGNSSETAWKGIHPLEDLVQLQNPSSGYFQNNNLSPDMMLEQSPLTADRYAPEVFSDTPGRTNRRGRRAIDLLSRTFQATLPDILDVLFDEKWVDTELWQEALRRAANRHPEIVAAESAEFRRVLDRVLRFDGVARKESVAALDYLYWRNALSTDTVTIGPLTKAIERENGAPDRYDGFLIQGLRQAIATLHAERGTTEVPMGEVFRAGRGGRSWPMGSGRLWAGDGFVGTMRGMVFGEPDSLGYRWLHTGQRQPIVVIFTNPIQSYTSLNFGQSNHPSSIHFADQSRLMSEKRLKPTYFDESVLLNHVVSEKTLTVRVQ